jgi:hypothetical protein
MSGKTSEVPGSDPRNRRRRAARGNIASGSTWASIRRPQSGETKVTSHPQPLSPRVLAVLAELTPEPQRAIDIGRRLHLTHSQVGNDQRRLSARGLASGCNGRWRLWDAGDA